MVEKSNSERQHREKKKKREKANETKTNDSKVFKSRPFFHFATTKFFMDEDFAQFHMQSHQFYYE